MIERIGSDGDRGLWPAGAAAPQPPEIPDGHGSYFDRDTVPWPAPEVAAEFRDHLTRIERGLAAASPAAAQAMAAHAGPQAVEDRRAQVLAGMREETDPVTLAGFAATAAGWLTELLTPAPERAEPGGTAAGSP